MSIDICVILAMPDKQYQVQLTVPAGIQAREAVRAALDTEFLGTGVVDIDPLTAPLGVFNERVDDEAVLQAGDRLEIYRPLQQDPMELRRERARLAKKS